MFGQFFEENQKGYTKEGIGCPLKMYESFVALKVIEWVDGTVIQLNLRHLKPTRNRFVENLLREGWTGADAELLDGILVIYLELI